MKRADNPPNRFEAAYVEWIGEPPPAPLEVSEERSREILSENDSPDIPFRWSVNPYRGCQHACSYCYARPTHEYLGLGAGSDFDTKIRVKVNAPELLDAALSRPGWKRESITFSGVTDCYQPLESVYGLTRRCIDVCLARSNPIGIVTKSYLVVRDIDLLGRMARDGLVRVYASIPFAEDRLARVIEPGAPPPSRRFDALRQLSAAGIPTGVMVAPIIPGLNDREVADVLERAASSGARSAGYIPLRLPGSVSDVFLDRLRASLPERAVRVETRIREMRGGRLSDGRFGARMRGEGAYWATVERLFMTTARRLGLRTREESLPAGRPRGGRALEIPSSVQLPLFGA